MTRATLLGGPKTAKCSNVAAKRGDACLQLGGVLMARTDLARQAI